MEISNTLRDSHSLLTQLESDKLLIVHKIPLAYEVGKAGFEPRPIENRRDQARPRNTTDQQTVHETLHYTTGLEVAPRDVEISLIISQHESPPTTPCAPSCAPSRGAPHLSFSSAIQLQASALSKCPRHPIPPPQQTRLPTLPPLPNPKSLSPSPKHPIPAPRPST